MEHLQIYGRAQWWQSFFSPRGLSQGTQTTKNSWDRLTGIISLGPQFLFLDGLFCFISPVVSTGFEISKMTSSLSIWDLGWDGWTIWGLHEHLSFQAASSHGYLGLLHDMAVSGYSFPRTTFSRWLGGSHKGFNDLAPQFSKYFFPHSICQVSH